VQVSRPLGIRDSNWELRPLTKRQYNYAVEDGFITALLFMQMVASLHKNNQGSELSNACIKID
jgi:ribonuclease D